MKKIKQMYNFEIIVMSTGFLNKQIGAGVYTVPDIAFILSLPQAKVRRWLNEFWNGRFASNTSNKYSWGEGKDKATNFYTLIEFYVFYHLRETGLSAKKIIEAHQEMSTCFKTPYPFASVSLLTDGRNIIFRTEDGIAANADRKRQILLFDLIKDFYSKIEFSNDIAERFWPLGKDKKIVVDPHHQFGQPVIEKTNILAETIHDLHSAGETIPYIERLYEISSQEIKDALALYKRKAA